MIFPPTNMQLRAPADGDHPWLVALHNDPEVLRNLTDPRPITLEQHLGWWYGIRIDPKQLRLVFTVDGDPVGFTKFYNIDRVNNNCVLGADIHKNHRGRGLARLMWAMMLNVSFMSLNLKRVSLTTADYNVIAQRVYNGLGFKEEGRQVKSLHRDGQYHDQICMYMLDEDWLPPLTQKTVYGHG